MDARILATLLALCRLAMAAFFMLAAVGKLGNPQFFAMSILEFKLLPAGELGDALAMGATFIVPWCELLCAVLLFLGLWTRAAALISMVLLAAFTAALVSVIVRGLNVSCGCFGDVDLFCGDKVTWCNVRRNAFFLSLTIVPLVVGSGALGLDALDKASGTPKGTGV